MCEITQTEKEKLEIILAAFLLAYMPKQKVFDAAMDMLEGLTPARTPQ